MENWTKGPWKLAARRDHCDEYYCVLEPIGLHMPDSIKDGDAHLMSASPNLYTAHVLRDAIDAYKDDRIGLDQICEICVRHGWIRKDDEPFYPFQFVKDYTARAMQKARGEVE